MSKFHPASDSRVTRLHLGSGPVVAEGWENLDKSPSVFLARFGRVRKALGRLGMLTVPQVTGFSEGTRYANVAKGLRYESNSIEFIYSSHMIEHLSRSQGLRLLRECSRVLAPGGRVRLATPDLRDIAAAYIGRDSPPGSPAVTADAFMRTLNMYCEDETSGIKGQIKKHVSGAWHQWLYDAESLAALMQEGGLIDICSRGYREGAVPDLDVLEHRPESLFMEGTKPTHAQGRVSRTSAGTWKERM